MLTEFTGVRQVEGEGRRRWFHDSDMDLIVWHDEHTPDDIAGFQLCYDKQGSERALTWRRAHGFEHHRIDDGEQPYSPKKTPILVEDGSLDSEAITRAFAAASVRIEPQLRKLVLDALADYPDGI